MFQKIFVSIILLIFSGLFLTFCGGGHADNAGDKADADTSKTTEKKSKENIEAVPVEIITVMRGDISDYILLSSNLETEVMADVYSRVQGIVESIEKEEGQFAAKGEVLMTLEAKEFDLAEQRARVQYDQQLSNYKRLEVMHEKKLLSDDEFEKARYTMVAAEISWKEARLNLDYTKITSPIAGRVGERLAKIGKRIQPVDKLFSVVDNSQVIAVVYVPEKNLNQLKIGQRAVITSDNLPDQKFSGAIKRISPVVDPASGTFKVTVGVNNAGNDLRPGMFVNVHIIIDTHKNSILIPKTAVVYENEWVNIYVVRDSVAHKIRMSPGFQDSEKIESLQDVAEGEKVIVVGQAGMKDKTRVKIVSERENRLAVGNKD
jgi:membrane fusion protein (multidrug efflux system)